MVMRECLSVWIILAMLPTGAAGQECVSPPNEACGGAIDLTIDDLPLATSGVYGCFNNTPPNGVDKPYWDVYYRYDCTCTGIYTLNMCDSTADAFMRIYADGCGFVLGTEYATGDDECPGSPPNADPLITTIFFSGTSYWFALGTWRPNPPWGPSEPNAPFLFNVSACAPCGNADMNGDGDINALDIRGFVNELLNPGPVDQASCPADISGNDIVGIEDLDLFVTALLS